MTDHEDTPSNSPQERRKFDLTAILLGVVSLIGLPLSLFLSAGRWDWLEGWVYVGLTLLSTLFSRLLMARINPDLVVERARSMSADNVKSWDKWLMPYMAVLGPLFVFITAGLNKRWGWLPDLPLWLELLGIPLILAGVAIATWAMIVNPFFSGTVRIQTERGHLVIESGPYRCVRHPGYLGGVLGYLAMPLMLGSIWAYIPVAAGILMTALRTHLEDETLKRELQGYEEYSHRTRYRLIPGIW
ncbi:MAG: isoprenylcysteine carboxylmethyltransferase family protein [Anaerolineaceae bacterium]